VHEPGVGALPGGAVHVHLGESLQGAEDVALMGRLSKYFPEIPEHAWEEAIDAIVAEKFRALNHKAFELGRNA
jgi:hypothetical protein